MDYRLCYVKGSASDGVRVILEEIGVPYELIQSTKSPFLHNKFVWVNLHLIRWNQLDF